ncbi:hypothetical protein [Sphingobium sp. BS19]|uniref:hypothetical protein n=1 Tax=Sphingobium sp. BS19 TaxID=3018973 RepID=UPI00249301B3|nr:hypothetical protein [Sphingobium sp. BS19]
MGLAAFVLALWLVWQEFVRCFLLLRRVHHMSRRGGFWQILRTMVRLAATDGALFSLDRRTLSRRTRILIEHELLGETPKPLRDWRDGGEAWSEAFLPVRLWVAMRNYVRTWRAYLHRSRVWWRDIGPALKLHGDWTIYVDNPSLVNAKIDEIQSYFECLRSLGYEGSEGDRFICPIEVKTGFIAPLHLLTGLYAKFDENWGPIIRSFDQDVDAGGYTPDAAVDRDLRQIQLFIYNCWLLWGPSIPICECRNWNARYSVIQYGFGDENNSIELVGRTKLIKEALAELLHAQKEQERATRTVGAQRPEIMPFLGMAIPANVKGRLRLSGSLGGRSSEQVNALPIAALKSWGGLQNERPVLFISEIDYTNAVDGDVESLNRDRGHIAVDGNALPSRYYSAYLWVAIVVLLPTPNGLTPLSHTQTLTPEPWKDFIPFFEHGNLADPESCLFGKRQLAVKVVTGLAAALKSWGTDRDPLHFAFASSIDEPGCGHALAHPEWDGHVTMRHLIGQALEDLARTDRDVKRLRDENLLRMDYFSGAPQQHPFSSCTFPEIVSSHYKVIDAANADLRS